jgi:hypothetical protein
MAANADLDRACELGSSPACRMKARREAGKPVLETAIDQQSIALALEATYVSTWACFEATLGQAEAADNDGPVVHDATAWLIVGADGVPTAADMTAAELDEAARTCLSEALMGARFGPLPREEGARIGWGLTYTQDSPETAQAGIVKVHSASGRDGAPTAAAVRNSLNKDRVDLRACFERYPPAPDAWPEAVQFTAKVTAKGILKGAKLVQTTGAEDRDTCVLEVIARPRDHGDFEWPTKIDGEYLLPALPHLPHAVAD